MMRTLHLIIFISLLLYCSNGYGQELLTRFEQTKGKESAPYHEAINYYKQLDRKYKEIQMAEAGPTDMIHPLHVVYYNKDGGFDIQEWKSNNKLIILVNNGIHPGEPDGIDASMMLLRDAATGKISVPEQVVLAVIPVFNIGGALNRGSYSRANQNGPIEYGFRGSAQNLDLNRDFIKMDAKETQTLVQLFHRLDPDLFIDNHVSNGADYQHVMTLLSVNPAKQGFFMGKYLQDKFEPWIYQDMKQNGYDLMPYVNHWGHTPDSGWQQFYEPPRFLSGFASLFGTFTFVPETHMLKPYDQRVWATYDLMKSFIRFAADGKQEIQAVRKKEAEHLAAKKEMVLDWRVDTAAFTSIPFKGYAAAYKPSEVSGLPRLYYDKNKPYEKSVRFYNTFKPSVTVNAPQAYVIRQGWNRVISRLRMNNVKMQQLKRDSTLELTVYRINRYESPTRPYEGHYLHSKVAYTSKKETVRLLAGDYIVPLNQKAKRYLVETLEPNAPDAFFAWGFFDAILQQKEYFSDYIFEDEAAALLAKDPALKKQLEDKSMADPDFAKDGRAQLDFIYRHSPYYEPVHMQYPVFRID